MAKSLTKFVGQALLGCRRAFARRPSPTTLPRKPRSACPPEVTHASCSASFYDDIKVIPGLFSIVHSENRGVAFGVFNDSDSQWRTALLVALSKAAVFVGQALLGCRRAFARRPSPTILPRKPRSAYPREASHAH